MDPQPSDQKKRPRDVNALAALIVSETTGEDVPRDDGDKNPAAVALGKLGGAKGGHARAAKLTPEQRREIARKAAAMAAGKADRVWTVEDIAALLDRPIARVPWAGQNL